MPSNLTKCQYCDTKLKLVSTQDIYPHILESFGNFWLCPKCKAYVGCHHGTDTPLGTVANTELRKLRAQLHHKMDKLWKDGHMKRKDVYHLLRSTLSLKKDQCHVAMFDIDLCKRALTIITNKVRKYNYV